MRMLTMSEERKKLRFVNAAKVFLNVNPKCYSYGVLEPVEYFAMRFGMFDDCLVVFKIDSDCSIENYQQILDRKESE
jgi:hypothetical protein